MKTAASDVVVHYPGDRSSIMKDIWQFAGQPNIGRRVIFDARLALTLRHWGVVEFATRNREHFELFGFTRVWNPIS